MMQDPVSWSRAASIASRRPRERAGTIEALTQRIAACRLCDARFQHTATQHRPRPVVWFAPGARIMVCGQAPGMRVHHSGKPFDDRSGDRLRDWMGIDRRIFYDRSKLAIVPMAFCFPGYDAKGSDLPPPKICAETWHNQVMDALPEMPLTVLVGGYAHRFHLGTKAGVTDTVAAWRRWAPRIIPLPHPSWRNTGWLKRNSWFERDVLPVLKSRVAEVLQ